MDLCVAPYLLFFLPWSPLGFSVSLASSDILSRLPWPSTRSFGTLSQMGASSMPAAHATIQSGRWGDVVGPGSAFSILSL